MDDQKTKTTEEVSHKEPIGAGIEEHPISEADAKKFAGAGDFALPTQENPLDSLISETKEEEKKVVAPATASPQPRPVNQSQPAAQPMPIPGNVDTKDLEKKAKNMLKDLGQVETKSDKPVGKPKKRGGGAATKMALAAVLVVMMGAGGVVGMNLLKMEQVGENRSQATAGFCKLSENFEDNNTCVGIAGITGKKNTVTGECCVTSNAICTPDCDSYSFCATSCTTAGGSVDPDADYSCDSNGCSSKDINKCWVSYFYTTDASSNHVIVANCHDGSSGGVEVLACAEASATFDRCKCGAHQIDVYCAAGGTDSRTLRLRPEDSDCDECGDDGEETSEQLLCTDLIADKPAPKIGETVTFTCSHSGDGKDRYEYRYKLLSDADWTSLGTVNTLTISKVGDYSIQCRTCDANNSCTTWGLAE